MKLPLRQLATALFLLPLLLGGCSSFRVDPLPDGLSDQPPQGWADRQASLESLQHWELTGKLAVRQPSDSATAIINHWQQDNDFYNLSLSSSFLGMGQTRLQGTPGFIELTLPDGETYHASDPEALIEAATGWQLPITSLTWWIRGLPGPGGDFRLLFDTSGALAVIRQQGWEVRYDRWHKFIDHYPPLPARITAVKGEKRVRLAVTGWKNTGEAP